MTDAEISENYAIFKKILSLEVGHTENCIDRTMKMIGILIHDVCFELKVSPESVIDYIGLVELERNLINILEYKDCDCKSVMAKK